MCNYCSEFAIDGRRILDMKSGKPHTYSVKTMEIARMNDSPNGDIYIVICKKPYDGEREILMKSFDPILYCPFCGKKL